MSGFPVGSKQFLQQKQQQQTKVKACVNRLPSVPCDEPQDCVRWAKDNCSESELRSGVVTCHNQLNTCVFTGFGRDPIIYGGDGYQNF